MGCLVSSLVQVMCDPHCRTQGGFQGLVQKEWVMSGHRFYSRLNYHRDNDKEEVRGMGVCVCVCVCVGVCVLYTICGTNCMCEVYWCGVFIF